MSSPLLKRVPYPHLPADLQAAFDASKKLRGDATFFEIFANNKELYDWYIDRFYGELFKSSRIEQKVKELARIKLSSEHGCKFCNQGNRNDALSCGLSEDQIDHLHDYENDLFSEKEKSVLRLADELKLTNYKGKLNESLYNNLRTFFDDATILELGLIMGMLSGIAKFLFVYDIVEKEENCPF